MEKQIKILVVDDDENTRNLYTTVLRDSGFDVLEAVDGVEGLDIATRENPDIIFTGIIMPRMDGFSMMESLKKNVSTSKTPVVISSHIGREEDKVRAEELGAKDFIVRGETSPKQAMERIKSIFEKGEYDLDFDPYAMGAPILSRDLKINGDFTCSNCKKKIIMKVNLNESEEGAFNGKLICSGCGTLVK